MVNICPSGAPGLVGAKRGTQAGQLLVGLQSAEALGLAASIMAAAVHRGAMATSRYRLTFRQIRRMVLFMFSMMLVQGKDGAARWAGAGG